MINYFALLEQPRRPWIDADKLKQVFHAKALQQHPDISVGDIDRTESSDSFAQLNEAYQVLQDPKRRLHHLLTLSGNAPGKAPAALPKPLEELFPVIAAATHRAGEAVQKSRATTNALSRSLLKRELVLAGEELTHLLQQISALEAQALAALKAADAAWSDEAPEHTSLHALYLQFSYLGRWRREVSEKQTALLTC